MPRPFLLAGLEEIEHQLVVGHQHERGLVHNGDVVQLLVRVSGGQDRHRRLVHRRPAHAGIQIAGRERRRGHAAHAGAAVWCVQKFPGDALVLGNEPAREVEGAAGDVRVDVDTAGEHDHAARIDGAIVLRTLRVSDDTAIGDADVFDDAVDAVGRVVDCPAADSKH